MSKDKKLLLYEKYLKGIVQFYEDGSPLNNPADMYNAERILIQAGVLKKKSYKKKTIKSI